MKKIAIVLSGCGVMDGSEIHEAVACMLACDHAGIAYQCIAPNIEQTQVINHVNNEKANEVRNVLVESARIARGNIKDISHVNEKDFDAAIYPGGYGAALNLCNFASVGVDHEVQKAVLHFAKAMAEAKKPQGFACIAPALIAKIYGSGVTMTIGSDPGTAEAMQQMGNQHKIVSATDIVVDQAHKVVSTPAYMAAKNMKEVFEGIDKMVKKVIDLI